MNGTSRAWSSALLAVVALLLALVFCVQPAFAAENREVAAFRRAAIADGWTTDEIEAVIEAAWGDGSVSAPVQPAPAPQVTAPATQPTTQKSASTTAVTVKTVAPDNSVADVIRRVASESGLDETQANALVKLAYRESRLDPNARSSTGKYLGLFQLDQGMCDENWADPEWNCRRALKYITARYGSPARALSHSYSHGWY
ncbi:MAG: hypothetical protein AB2L09_11460 [Coriobacteriia bacterium]